MRKVAPKPHAALVLEAIESAAKQYHAGRDARIHAIRQGREAGLTYAQIGERLGITDAAVIGLLKRAGGPGVSGVCHLAGQDCTTCGAVAA